MAGDMLEVSEPEESGEQLEAHPRASGADAAAAPAISGSASAATAGDISQLLEVQQGAAAGGEVALALEPGRRRMPNLWDGIRALKVLDESARQVSWGLQAMQGLPPPLGVCTLSHELG